MPEIIDIDQIIHEADNLPALPNVVNEIMEQMENEDVVPMDFTEIISKDPIITGKTLKLANSAFYGYSRSIDTISQAVVILGLDTLRSLVIAVSAHNLFKSTKSSLQLDLEKLWQHSLFTAICAKSIVRKLGFNNPEKYFIAGLLHDVGKILMLNYINKYYEKIEDTANKGKYPFYLAEKKVLGYNHQEIGEKLVFFWKLPQLIIDVVGFHHQPEKIETKNNLAVAVISVANQISYKADYGFGYNILKSEFKQEVYDSIGLTHELENEIIQEQKIEVADFNKYLTE